MRYGIDSRGIGRRCALALLAVMVMAACAGAPADPDTGALVKANADGTFTTLAEHLDQPSSLEIIGTAAYVITLGGEIWMIDGVTS